MDEEEKCVLRQRNLLYTIFYWKAPKSPFCLLNYWMVIPIDKIYFSLCRKTEFFIIN